MEESIQRRIVKWVDGIPAVSDVPIITKSQLQDLYAAAIAETFHCADPLDPDFQYDGMTCAEVMVRKQIRLAAMSGLREDVEGIMDRIMGKPKQSTETTKLSLTYEDTLKEIARKEDAKSLPHVFDPVDTL